MVQLDCEEEFIHKTTKLGLNKKEDLQQCVLQVFFLSDPPGARTQDPILKRDVLYLLS